MEKKKITVAQVQVRQALLATMSRYITNEDTLSLQYMFDQRDFQESVRKYLQVEDEQRKAESNV